MTNQTARLLAAMAEYDHHAGRIHHFVKVHGFACAIAALEGVDGETQFVLETAALVHDIGIRSCLEKFGSSRGSLQEQEGPAEAEAVLRSVGGYTEQQIDRVKYLVGHHHTYTDIDGIDYQILVEADFLVNLQESPDRYRAILAAEQRIFYTQSGKRLLHALFGLESE